MASTAQPDDPTAAPTGPSALLRLAAGDVAPRTAGTQLHPALLPAVDALPPQLEVTRLVKAAGLADAAERAERRSTREAAARCDADLDGVGSVKPWARTAARFLSCLYDEPELGGAAGRAGRSDHPGGLAVDFMVGKQRGDRIAACALANQEALGVDYVLWRQRANHGDGWERMSDRGGDTANHRDHVHISFERGAPAGTPLAQRCR